MATRDTQRRGAGGGGGAAGAGGSGGETAAGGHFPEEAPRHPEDDNDAPNELLAPLLEEWHECW
jgi:hypothetical protein